MSTSLPFLSWVKFNPFKCLIIVIIFSINYSCHASNFLRGFIEHQQNDSYERKNLDPAISSKVAELVDYTKKLVQVTLLQKCLIIIGPGASVQPTMSPITPRPTKNPTPGPTPYPPVVWTLKGQALNGVTSDELFGSSISLSGNGNEFVVGGLGFIRIYKLARTSWSIPVESTVFTNYVTACSMTSDGTHIVAGSPETSTSGGSGMVVVFEFDFLSNAWVQKGGAIKEGSPGQLFGFSVDIADSGDQIIIGAPGGDTPYIRVANFVQDTTWFSVRIDQNSERFGNSVSMTPDGSTAAVSASGDAGGSVFIYDITNLIIPVLGVISGDAEGFGWTCSISADGNTLAVGTLSADYIQIFRKSSGSWIQIGSNIEGQSDSGFGRSLSLSDDGLRLIVGAELINKAYIYEIGDSAEFQFLVESMVNNNFGSSVAISGDGAVAAIADELFDERANTNAGQLKVFQASR